ncbi:hypothetical protein COW64_09630 [bacterium (Candidatus Blackallbacteria) CG18_big_fil_WC_8_21_14_2_50_49_26]|nr:MAG: hypothetical protein COW64_09630 [bacterium (Candidatus Blackallbacteria) CG18_big_fil_WC_8_21_14_2_50_49_26]
MKAFSDSHTSASEAGLATLLKAEKIKEILAWTGFSDFITFEQTLLTLLNSHGPSEVKAFQAVHGQRQNAWVIEFKCGALEMLHLYPPEMNQAQLMAILQIQKIVHAQKYPCPLPLSPPLQLGKTLISLEQFLHGERSLSAHHEQDIRMMAFSLAQLHQATCSFRFLPHLPANQLSFNSKEFSKSTLKPFPPDCEWLLSLTHPLRRRLKQKVGREVLSPSEWYPEDFCFQHAKICGVFGWKTLSRESELWVVSQSVTHFTHAKYASHKAPPNPVEIKRFVAAFEEARGVPFDTKERRYLEASITWCMARTALKEQLEDPKALNWKGSYREALTQQKSPYFLSLL